MRLVITGAAGWLARELARQAHDANINTLGISSNPGACKTAYDSVVGVDTVGNNLFTTNDVVVHCAFSRKSVPQRLCVSLDYAKRIFLAAGNAHVRGIVNISTQAVYGSFSGNANEDTQLCPDYPYALAKVASEEILSGIMSAMAPNDVPYTNIRLTSLIGVSSGETPNNVLYKFIQKALSGQPISIVGGEQNFSFINVKDAAHGLLLLCRANPHQWSRIFNLGSGCQTSICDMAKLVQAAVSQKFGIRTVPTEINAGAEHATVDVGMDCELLYAFLQWEPSMSFMETVEETVDYCANTQ